MYGTVMTATLTGSADQLRSAAEEWAMKRPAPGFRREEILIGDDGRSVVAAVFFDSKEDYERLADDPEQDTWWSGQMAPLLSDVTWTDGSWQAPLTPAPATLLHGAGHERIVPALAARADAGPPRESDARPSRRGR